MTGGDGGFLRWAVGKLSYYVCEGDGEEKEEDDDELGFLLVEASLAVNLIL